MSVNALRRKVTSRISWLQGHTASRWLPFHLGLHRSSSLSSVLDESIPLLCHPSAYLGPTQMTFGTLVSTGTFSSPPSWTVACANPSMKSAFAPAKNRKDRTSAAAWRAATLSGSGDFPSLENTFPKNFTARRLSLLFFRLSLSPCSRYSLNMCLSVSPCSSGVAPKTVCHHRC